MKKDFIKFLYTNIYNFYYTFHTKTCYYMNTTFDLILEIFSIVIIVFISSSEIRRLSWTDMNCTGAWNLTVVIYQ